MLNFDSVNTVYKDLTPKADASSQFATDARIRHPHEIKIAIVDAVLAGQKQTDAAKEFGVSRQSVNQYIKLYNEGTLKR